MNDAAPVIATDVPQRARARSKALRAFLLAVAALAALIGAALIGIDTPAGHRLLAARVSALRTTSGLRVRIGRIDGSIWTASRLRDVELYDLRGRFLRAPVVQLDWHPLAWIANRLDVDALDVPVVELARAPVLRPAKGGPLLPGFDIRLGRLHVQRLRLAPAIAGRPQTLALAGHAIVRQGEAVIGVTLASGAGDRVALDLDARPALDRFRLAASLNGPQGGVIAGMLGVGQDVALDVGGAGDWHGWRGAATGRLGRSPLARLALAAREGRYRLSGSLRPSALLHGKLARLTAPAVRIAGDGRFANRRLDGTLLLAMPAARVTARGGVDLATSTYRGVRLDARLLQPRALFPNMSGDDVLLHVGLEGAFRTPAFSYLLTSPHIAFDQTGFDRVRLAGIGRFGRFPVIVPIRLQADRVTGVGDVAGGILADLAVTGALRLGARTLTGDALRLTSDKLAGTLALSLDLATGKFAIGVSGGLRRYLIPGLGLVDVTTKAMVTPGPAGQGAAITGRGIVDVRRFDNALLRSLAGGNPHIETGLVRDPDGVLHFPDLVLTGPSIRIAGTGLRRRDGSFQFSGTGTQAQYGALRLELDGMIDHPQVRLQLAAPLATLGLRDVALSLDPVPGGFRYQVGGGSLLGRFAGNGAINAPPGQATAIDVADLSISGTHAHGTVRAEAQGFAGRLDLAGGGISGALGFSTVGALRRIDPHLAFAGATLSLSTPVAVHGGRLDGQILLDPANTGLDLRASGDGLVRGGVALGRASAIVRMRGGRGSVALTAAATGGRAFDLAAGLGIQPDRVALSLKGTVGGRPLALESPARFDRTATGWALERTRIDYGGGSVALGGRYGNAGLAIDLGLDRLPLKLLDLLYPQLGLAGYASGSLSYSRAGDGLPAGRLDLALRGLSRSGAVVSSQPADIAVTARLAGDGAAVRAVVASGGRTIGRAQARIGAFGGDLGQVAAAPLFAQLRYAGPAETLWRLTGVETLDLSGPLQIGADVGGSLGAPLIRGTVRSDGGRIESNSSGTVVTGVRATGRFDGGRLLLDSLAGKAGAGTVAGKASIDLGHLAKGVGLDFQLQADNAALLGRDDIAATVTGPLFIRSSGQGGTVGGHVEINRGRFRLGAAAAAQVPRIATVELHRRDDDQPDAAPSAPWTLDLHAHARDQLMVAGLGIDSEWKATLDIAGAVDNPAIAGRVDLVRGGYQFAGRRFELARGLIRFGGQAPPDPTLDITADADVTGFSATIHVSGTGLHPEITFRSVPSLPEDELLSRLLFGTSIANLSAPEALQLASAVASLRAGAGGGMNLDPINAVRRIVRLDRLRILPADPTTGQKTAVAAGKYIGRRTYVELITDGQGYSATSVEFRITRWLSLLSTVSTVGRQSANVKVSKDY